MKKEELLKLEVGKYRLTDEINNYQYDLLVSTANDGKRMFRILLSGSLPFNDSINIFENISINEDGDKEISLSATAGVGGLRIHSDDVYYILNQIKLVNHE